MSKHTPGPWAVCEKPLNEYWHEGRTVFSVPEKSRICDVTPLRNDGPALADARLIAAAPDMLAALRKAHRMLTRDYIDDAKMAVIDIVDAAIAKATGETSD